MKTKGESGCALVEVGLVICSHECFEMAAEQDTFMVHQEALMLFENTKLRCNTETAFNYASKVTT